ncbi:MAG: hypothetical protein ACI91F_000961 [Candidatus Binatia bacterium]|jgi:hypothetical protein
MSTMMTTMTTMTSIQAMTRMTILMTTINRQRGVALILVIWTFAVLTVLAGEFARAMRDDAMSTRNFKQETIGHYVCVAAINEVILALMTKREDRQPADDEYSDDDGQPLGAIDMLSIGDGQWTEGFFNGVAYEVRVTDEGGKLGLNHVGEVVLEEIFYNLGYEDLDAKTLVDSILDWRDEDEEHRLNGAEDDYYERLPRPYKAKDGAFDSVEELLLVRGVTEDLFYGFDDTPGLRELFSVFNRSDQYNQRSASPGLLFALSGADLEEVDRVHGLRTRNAGRETPAEVIALTGASSAKGNAQKHPVDMTIEARIVEEGDDGVVLSHIGAVLRLQNSGRGLRLYRWYDYVFEVEPERTASYHMESPPAG